MPLCTWERFLTGNARPNDTKRSAAPSASLAGTRWWVQALDLLHSAAGGERQKPVYRTFGASRTAAVERHSVMQVPSSPWAYSTPNG